MGKKKRQDGFKNMRLFDKSKAKLRPPPVTSKAARPGHGVARFRAELRDSDFAAPSARYRSNLPTTKRRMARPAEGSDSNVPGHLMAADFHDLQQ